MSVLTPPMSSPASLKRSYADSGLDDQNNDQITPTPNALLQVAASNQVCPLSPKPANLPIPTSPAASSSCTPAIPDPPAATVETSVKRAKLTFAEKEARQIEKQFKEQQKAEEKAKKEEEKRIKDAEKDERKKAKEAESLKKLEEKQKAEEEKNKKARVCHRRGSKSATLVMLTLYSRNYV